MNNKKKLILIIGLFILISATAFAYADDESYISEAYRNVTIQNDGMLHIEETYDYVLVGTVNGVTRNIPLKSEESVENLNVTAEGAYTECVKTIEDGEVKLKIYLYADKAHTQKIEDSTVTVHINYDMPKVVTVYNDIVSLQYQIWGNQWEINVNKITTTINMPGNSGNMYWLNPSQYNLTSSMTGNTITSVSTKISNGEFYELQLLMPTSDFKNSPHAKHSNIDAKDQIIQKQIDYQNNEKLFNNMFLIFGVLFIISPIIPLGIYLKYGREPKINYQALYEREPPTNEPPAKINALIEEHASDKPELKGFEATIMDLINRKIITIEKENEDELILNLNMEKTNETDRQETHLLNLLNRFASKQTLNLNDLKRQLKIQGNAEYFKEKYESWRELCKTDYLNNIDQYFNKKGKTVSNMYGIIGIILSLILGYFAINSSLPTSKIGLIGSAILLITSVICLFLPNDVFGHWSEEGKEYNEKWKNFKKFLKDNSLLNEHPPESIVIWNQYLVYATALGVADNVYDAMKIHIPPDSYYYDDLFIFHYYGGMWIMHDAINTGFDTLSSEASSGLGDIGGGSGGGGGGVF